MLKFFRLTAVLGVFVVGNFALAEEALSPESTDSVAAVLEATDGAANVEVQRGGVWKKIGAEETIAPGESVRTGASSARLVYDDGSVVALSTNTEVKLEDEATRVVALERGTVWGKIEKAKTEPPTDQTKNPPYKFTLRSRSIVMGVRGTEFLVESGADGETAVNTLEGTVDTAPDLKALFSGRATPVAKHERIRARLGAAFGKAEAFKGEELVARLKSEHGGLARFLGRPVRRLLPARGARARNEGPADRLRRKAAIRARPDGALQPGQGKFGTPGRRHR